MPRRTNKQKLFASQVGGAGVLVGLKAISDAFGVSVATLKRWQRKQGLSGYMTKLPGGETLTTVFQLDRWVSDRGKLPMVRARNALAELSRSERLQLLLEAAEMDPAKADV